jgi:hypothetical protein
MPIIVPLGKLHGGLLDLESECLKTLAMLGSYKMRVSKLMKKVLIRIKKWPYFKS